MKKAELLSSLAALAKELGVTPTSQSKFERWIDKNLLAGAIGRGVRRGVPRDWSYSEDDVRRAHALVILQARGFKRTHQLFLGLAVEGFSVSTDQLRQSLRTEAVRAIKRQRRESLRNFVPQEAGASIDNISKEQLRLSTEVDPILKDTGFVLPPDLMRVGINSAVGGTSDNPLQSTAYQTAVENELRAALPGSLPFDPLPMPLKPITRLMAGILGFAEETDISLADRINGATDNELTDALADYRGILRELKEAGDFLQLMPEPIGSVLLGSLQDPNWLPLMLSLFVSMASSGSNSDEISATNV